MQDVIGRDVDDRPSRVHLPSWRGLPRPARLGAVALVAGACAVALAAVRVPADTTPPDVAVVVDHGRSTATGPTATGALEVRVVNPSATRARVDRVGLAVRGLRVLSVEPSRAGSVAPDGERRYVLRYEVPDCAELRLPGLLEVSLAGGTRSARVVGRVPADGDAVAFRPCPVSALPAPALAVRVLAGTSERAAAGARGAVRLEVRNGGPAVRLLSVAAEVPGVRSSAVVPGRSAMLREDDRAEVLLRFDVDDCADVVRTGRLVVHAVRNGVERELGLTLAHDFEGRRLRQLALDHVFTACGR